MSPLIKQYSSFLLPLLLVVGCGSDTIRAPQASWQIQECGDAICAAEEDATTCPLDCDDSPEPSSQCGDGRCEAAEDASCPQDCNAPPPAAECGDGVCSEDESRRTCMTDCQDTWRSEDDLVLTFELSPHVLTQALVLTLASHDSSEERFTYAVDWNNDGIFDERGTSIEPVDLYHEPAGTGEHTIRLRGTFGGFAPIRDDREGMTRLCHWNKPQLVDVKQWGSIAWRSMSLLFSNCRALQGWSAPDIPITSHVTDMSGMFWDAHAFNQPLDAWDVSQVTDMSEMFAGAQHFNQPLLPWDTSQVTDMSGMFSGTARFDQPIDFWDTSQVTNMSRMFEGASAFDRPLESWDTSRVTDMSRMFNGATAFNQPLAKWDTSQVTDMSFMFHRAETFDQPLASWDVSHVTNMSGMFFEAQRFNRPLDQWDVSQVTDMAWMFSQAALNQEHYDATLIGWAAQPTRQTDVMLDAEGLTYCVGEQARTLLTSAPYHWSITGDGRACP